TAAIEDHGFDAGLLGSCGEPLADFGSLLGLVALERGGQFLPRRSGERAAGIVVDELGEDALVRAEDEQARTLRGAADLAAHPAVATQASFTSCRLAHARLPTFLRTCSPS